MDKNLVELAKRIESQPWNRSGTDKTWVLKAMSMFLKFREEMQQARSVGTCRQHSTDPLR